VEQDAAQDAALKLLGRRDTVNTLSRFISSSSFIVVPKLGG